MESITLDFLSTLRVGQYFNLDGVMCVVIKTKDGLGYAARSLSRKIIIVAKITQFCACVPKNMFIGFYVVIVVVFAVLFRHFVFTLKHSQVFFFSIQPKHNLLRISRSFAVDPPPRTTL